MYSQPRATLTPSRISAAILSLPKKYINCGKISLFKFIDLLNYIDKIVHLMNFDSL